MGLESVFVEVVDGKERPIMGVRRIEMVPCKYEAIYVYEDDFKLIEVEVDEPALSVLAEVAQKEFSDVPFSHIGVGGSIGEYIVMSGYVKRESATSGCKETALFPYRVQQDEDYRRVEFFGRTALSDQCLTFADLVAVARKEFPGVPSCEIWAYLTLPEHLKGTGVGPTDVLGLASKTHIT